MIGGTTGEAASTSAGRPTRSDPSPGTSTIRSANGITRSSRCSATSTARPTSSTSRARVASTSSAAVGSSAEVGSSSTSSRGCIASTDPIATRCCCPPERVRRSRARSSAMPSRSRVSSTRRRIVAGGRPELLHPVGQLLLHRVGDEAGGRVLPDVPDRVHPLARRQVQDALAVEQQVAAQLAAGEPRHQAREHAEQRRLPGAGRPGDHHQLALVEVEVDAREHRAVVVGQPRVAQRDHRGAHAGPRRGRAQGGGRRAGAPPRAMPAASSTAGLSTGTTATPG